MQPSSPQVFVTSFNQLICLEGQAQKWICNLPSGADRDDLELISVSDSGASVFVTTRGNVHHVDAATGKHLWEQELVKKHEGVSGDFLCLESCGGSVIVAGCGKVFVLEAKSGSVVAEIPLKLRGAPHVFHHATLSLVVAKAQNLAFVAGSGHLACIDFVKRIVLWQHDLKLSRTGSYALALHNLDRPDPFLIMAGNGRVQVFNTSSGESIATVKIGGVSSAPCTIWVSPDGTCFVSGPTSVSAFSVPALKLMWTSKLKNSGLLSSIAKMNDSIIVGQDKQLTCLSASTGDIRWSGQLSVNNKDKMHGLQIVPFDGEHFLAAGYDHIALANSTRIDRLASHDSKFQR
jgi:outer membrane protein assembly factor BamB